MLFKIRKNIEKDLRGFIDEIGEKYALKEISPLLFNQIRDFVLRPGKRIRPSLLAISYLGFTKKPAPGLYTTAVSLEMLHDFMLVHDDIVDKSDTRRGKPSMHRMFQKHLGKYKGLKFNGQDLAIVAGDVMYAAAIHAFLSIKVKWQHKENALKRFIKAAMYTGSGEFIELLGGIKSLDKISREDIYRIYDLKTAYYTFATPLSTGAILAGAGDKQADILFKYGIQIGRAFQIKDDILGIFHEEKKIGKPSLADLREAKKTLLVWHAYHNSGSGTRKTIKNLLNKQGAGKKDLLKIREIFSACSTLEYAKGQITRCLDRADSLLTSCRIKPDFKKLLSGYTQDILKL